MSGVGDNALGSTLQLVMQSGGRCLVVERQTAAESQGDWSADVALAQQVLQGLGTS